MGELSHACGALISIFKEMEKCYKYQPSKNPVSRSRVTLLYCALEPETGCLIDIKSGGLTDRRDLGGFSRAASF